MLSSKGVTGLTRMLVLSLLDYEPMSGYDIKQMLEMTDAERRGGVLIGSIYHALKENGIGRLRGSSEYRANRTSAEGDLFHYG